jgi:methylmalonyl-CoA mutase C-terminal domain/subunit
VVGLSILSGAHTPLIGEIQKLFKKHKVNKPIFVGGIIPADDEKKLLKSGVRAVFGPGTSIADIVKKVHSLI